MATRGEPKFVQIACSMSGADLESSTWQLYALDSDGDVWAIVYPDDHPGGAWDRMTTERLP